MALFTKMLMIFAFWANRCRSDAVENNSRIVLSLRSAVVFVVAVYLYLGSPGMGKTSTVMIDHVLPGIASKRNIIHNIDGVKFGSPLKDNFDDIPNVNISGGITTFTNGCVGGSLIIIDELGLYLTYETIKHRMDHFLRFLAAHRKHVAGGQSCDVVIIAQDDSQFPYHISKKVQRTTIMRKHPVLPQWTVKEHSLFGMKWTRRIGGFYRLDFDGFQRVEKPASAASNKEYFKPPLSVFSLYNSYAGCGFAHENLKEGGRFFYILKWPLLFLSVCVGVIVFSGGLEPLSRLWSPPVNEPKLVVSVQDVKRKKRNLCRLLIDGQCFYQEFHK